MRGLLRRRRVKDQEVQDQEVQDQQVLKSHCSSQHMLGQEVLKLLTAPPAAALRLLRLLNISAAEMNGALWGPIPHLIAKVQCL